MTDLFRPMKKQKLVKWGYGIVSKDGEPYMDECCVCEEKVALLDLISDMDEPRLWRVVPLYFRSYTNRHKAVKHVI